MKFRVRRRLILGGMSLLVFGMLWARARARTDPGAAGPAHAGTQTASLMFGGRIRTYLLHLPSGYEAGKPLPLVFVLHGATQSDQSAEKMSGMSAQADQNRFIAVYPAGTGRLSEIPTWNAGSCCGYALQNNVDDIGFFRALIGRLEHEYSVDRKRIYFTGISNGAAMSYRVACEMADQVAAIAPVEGALSIDCHPAEPVSALIFNGTADRLVPFNGRSRSIEPGSSVTGNSAPDSAQFWATHDACAPAPEHAETTEAHIDTYSRCEQGTGVVLYAIQGGHHMWPGLRISGNSIPATKLIWTFFAAHPKP